MRKPLWIDRVLVDLVKKEFIPIKILFLCIHGGANVLFPFLTLHARSLGITEWELGVVYGFNPVIALFGPPVIGIIADKIGNFKVMLSVTMAASGFAALLFIAVPQGRVTYPLPSHLSLILEPPSSHASLDLPRPLSCQLRPHLSLTLINCTTNTNCSRWEENNKSDDRELMVQLEGLVLPRADNTSSLLHFVNATVASQTLSNFNSTMLILHMINMNETGTGKDEDEAWWWSGDKGNPECRVECQAPTTSLCSNTDTVLDIDSSLTFWSYFLVRILNTLMIETTLDRLVSSNSFLNDVVCHQNISFFMKDICLLKAISYVYWLWIWFS
ncbi:hypothetical protein Pcinc_036131 [Petrolisthes cinctipes]|uniref:Major facilitator superfamily associated domain-containing protein n=1 Tax=Petrolisthes cinctipes TaxID=88211 RepID=A0AAE1BWA9_PETCI|nr:hypothetical protein Pcinc_036131 [Petrolisthes cinctipes]